MVIRTYVYVLLTFYQFPNYTKHWKSEESIGHISAAFEGFNGKQDFALKRDQKGEFVLKYAVSLKSGNLSLELRRDSKIIIQRNINGRLTDSVQLEKTGNEKYHVTFRASKAEGQFDLKYN
jgi:hypothetical protein